MLIDWFTVGAQALNFLILVWLMKRFLYKPILDAIDAREKRIAEDLADAEAKRTEAQTQRDAFHKKNEAFDQQRATLLSEATEAAKAERLRLLDEARQTADALSAKHLETLLHDAQNQSQALARRAQDEVFAIARQALADLASADLEGRMADVFTRRLRAMDEPTQASLATALKTEPALLRSAFALSTEQQAQVQTALNETFSTEVQLRFETKPDLISGIELTANAQKLAWNISDYLASLQKGVVALLEKKREPIAKAEAQA